MKHIIIILFALITSPISSLFGSDSDYNIKISLLTCAPGQDLYSIYGHNGIRISNQDAGIDVVYNFGTFDFEEKGFMIKFMRGKLPYSISMATYDQFLYEYNYFRRSVREQVLMLDSTEKQKIIQFLDWNMIKENRTYKYDFFKDNCATRLRDIINHQVKNVKWETRLSSGKTFREIIKEYQYNMKWTDFGIDLIIGSPADQVTTLSEESFIPDYLAKAVSYAKNGNSALQQADNQILKFENINKKTPFLLSPWFVFLLLLGLEVFVFIRFVKGDRQKWTKYFDRIWVGTLILSMILMLFMWFGTDHIPTKYNYNLLWCSPLLPVYYFLNQNSKLSKWIFCLVLGLMMVCICNAIPGIRLLPQYFHPLVIIISIIMIIKVIRWKMNDAAEVAQT